MKEVPYIRWRYAEWFAGKISRRPALEQALFINLQGLCMRDGGAVQMDDVNLLDMADRLHVEIDDIRSAISNLAARRIINREGDVVTIKFLSAQIEQIQEIAAKRRESAKARWGNANASGSNANALRSDANASPVMQSDASYSEKEKEKEKERSIEEKSIKKPKKNRLGEHNNVLLTDQEHERLLSGWGQDGHGQLKKYCNRGLDWAIDELSCYLASNGKRYKSHMAVLQGWVYKKYKEDYTPPTAGRGKIEPVVTPEARKALEELAIEFGTRGR